MSGWRGHVVESVEPEPAVLSAAAAVYAAASPGKGDDRANRFVVTVRRYVAEREGARLAWVEGPAGGGPVAVALGVVGTPGTWWRDVVAGFLADETTVDRVLGRRCLEVVHLAVAPGAQRRGHGRTVLDLLLAERPAPTAVLSCDPYSSPASRLYTSAGWSLVTDDFRLTPEQPPRWLMSRPLV